MLSRPGSCGDHLKSLFRGKEFLPGLLAENRDGNGSLPRSRNLISEKVFTRPSTLYGRERADIHHGPESMTPPKAEYITADQLPLIIFRLQPNGGPYIPIRRASNWMEDCTGQRDHRSYFVIFIFGNFRLTAATTEACSGFPELL